MDCEILACHEEAAYFDEMDNKICEFCMEESVANGEADYIDFETI